MKRILHTKRSARKRHYKSKLKYEIVSGYRVDYLEQKQRLRKTKNLLYRKRVNKGSLHVNALGIKTSRMPF